jgi:hypothetical protein
MKVHRSPKKPESEKQVLDVSVVHCPHCGRIWVRTREIGSDECAKCGGELYPVPRRLVAGEELRLGDGYEARVSQDKLLRDVKNTFWALIDQTKCSCQPGVRCTACRGRELLKNFPGPAKGTMEDDWATLRRRKLEDRSAKPHRELSPREKRLMEDILNLDEAADASDHPDEFDHLLD